jgi:hypothetical protein
MPPTPMYTPSIHVPLHLGYQSPLRSGRRIDFGRLGGGGSEFRSALLEEFRANKSKKWDLRVRPTYFFVFL